MKRIATVFFLLPLIIIAETLSLEKSAWRGNPLTWQAVPGGFKTIATGHTLEYTNAPLSENAEVEAVVTVEQRLQVSYSISAVALVQNASNFYHLALAERPLAAGGGHFGAHAAFGEERAGFCVPGHQRPGFRRPAQGYPDKQRLSASAPAHAHAIRRRPGGCVHPQGRA